MLYSVYTWNGHAINDTTNYHAYFSNDSFFKQADGPSKTAKRTDRPPVMLGVEPLGKNFFLAIIPKGTLHTQYDELNKWFDTHDKTLYQLIVKDTSDSDRQWYVNCRPVRETKMSPKDRVEFVMEALDPIWRTVTENSDSWDITASGQTRDITFLGNRKAYPTFKIKPTALKTTGSGYRMYRAWRNPNAVGQAKRLQDITDDAWNTSALISDNSNKCQINNGAGITDSDTTIPYDTVTGSLPSSGMGYCGTEQISWSGKTGTTSGNLTGVTRGIGGTVAAAHADNAVIYLSHLQADGRDVRVYVNGVSVPRWLRGMNTTTTQVFVNMDWSPGISLAISTAIDNTTEITQIEFPIEYILTLTKLVEQNNKAIVIGSEIFTFTTYDLPYRKITGVTRAAYSTTKAAHAVGDTAYWLEHNIQIAYGNASMSAPTQDETCAPLQDLDNTTNASWKWLTFSDKTGLRSGQWNAQPIKGFGTYIYFGSHLADADPSTELGLVGSSYEMNGAIRSDTYEAQASIYDMAGFTTVTANGDKYRAFTGFCTVAGLYKGSTDSFYTSVFNESTPASAATWTAWTQTAVSLSGTYNYLKLIIKGSAAAISGNYAAFETQAVTLALNSSNIPQLMFSGAELTDNYEVDLTLTNTDTDLFIKVRGPMDLDEEIEIDTEDKTVTYLKDNSNVFPFLDVDVRGEWMPFDPSVVSDNVNTLEVVDVGITTMTLTTTWSDRRA